MHSVKIHLLGIPQIEAAGHTATVDTRKAIALLAYIAEEERPVHRGTLSALLWPDYAPARAQANLRRTLWSLKQALTGEHLQVEQEWIGLSRTGTLWVDTWHLRHLLEQCRRHPHRDDDRCEFCRALLVEAIGLLEGDFLDGFGLADSAEFDDWQALQVINYRQQRIDILRRLVRGRIEAGELEQALLWARRWTALDSLDEPAHRQLMSLYAWSDQAAAALHTYRELERRLQHQLGVPPDEDTVKLYEAIRKRRISPQSVAPAISGNGVTLGAVPAGPPLPPMGEQIEAPPFVARASEMASLRASLVTAVGSQAQVRLIVGDPGSGKTALLQNFAHGAQQLYPDLVVAGGACNAYTGSGDPYLPFRQLLEALTGDLEVAAQFRVPFAPATEEELLRIWRLLPTAVQDLTTVGPDLINTFVAGHPLLARLVRHGEANARYYGVLERHISEHSDSRIDLTVNQTHLFEQVARLLQQVSLHAPLLLLVDDLQWADTGSVNLLFHLSRRLAGHRILLVGAYRPADVMLGRGQERHPLEPVLREMQGLYGDITIDLNQAQDRKLVDELVDQEANHLDESFRTTLLRQTGGHALFTVELLRGLKERGHLMRDQEGYWTALPELDWEAWPARVDAVISERIIRLPAEWQELLRFASIEGEEFTAEVVARGLGKSELEVVRTLSEQLDRKHNLVHALGVQRLGAQRRSRYRFRHYLIQHYLYHNQDVPTRSYLSELMAVALEESYGKQRVEIALQLARLFADAGLLEKAISYLWQAGDHALRLSANAEAIEHYRRALTLLRQLPVTPAQLSQQFGLESLLTAPMQMIMGFSAPDVVAAFDHALELGRQLDNPPEMVPLLGRAAHLRISLGEHAHALALAQETFELASRFEADDLLLEAYTVLGISHFYRGELEMATFNLTKALALYDYEQHFRLTYLYGQDPGVHAGLYAAVTLWQLGLPDQAYSLMENMLALADRTQHPHTRGFAQSFAALLYSFANDVPRMLEHSTIAKKICEQHGFPQFGALATGLHGAALAHSGRLKEGIAEFAHAKETAQQVDIVALYPYMLGLQAEIYRMTNQLDVALNLVETAQETMQRTGEALHAAWLYIQRGIVLLDDGVPWARARAEFEAALEVAHRQHAKSQVLQAAVTFYRLALQHAPAADQAVARQVLNQVFATFTEGFSTPNLIEAAALLT